jgi:hypothetical protein
MNETAPILIPWEKVMHGPERVFPSAYQPTDHQCIRGETFVLLRHEWRTAFLGWEGDVYAAEGDEERLRSALDGAEAAILILAWCAGVAQLARPAQPVVYDQLDELVWLVAHKLGTPWSWVRAEILWRGTVRIFVRGRSWTACSWALREIRPHVPGHLNVTIEPEGNEASPIYCDGFLGMPERAVPPPAHRRDFKPATGTSPGPWDAFGPAAAAAAKSAIACGMSASANERALARRKVDAVLAEDGRRFPAFASARRCAVLADIETAGGWRQQIDVAVLCEQLRTYEDARGGARRPAPEAVRRFTMGYASRENDLAAYERARALP